MVVFIAIITDHSAINVIISPVSHASGYQDTKHTQSHTRLVKQPITGSRNSNLLSEQSGKTAAELRGNQKKNDLEIQGDQMVALLGVKAPGLGGMNAWSVLGLTGQVKRDTLWEREHSGLEEPSHR